MCLCVTVCCVYVCVCECVCVCRPGNPTSEMEIDWFCYRSEMGHLGSREQQLLETRSDQDVI